MSEIRGACEPKHRKLGSKCNELPIYGEFDELQNIYEEDETTLDKPELFVDTDLLEAHSIGNNFAPEQLLMGSKYK